MHERSPPASTRSRRSRCGSCTSRSSRARARSGASRSTRTRQNVHRRDRMDAHLLAGEDVDRRARARCRSRCSTCTRSSTATLPWAEIDMDFMNLNQSAHGDREFGYIETRLGISRKTVVGHWRDPEVAARIGHWARAACGWHEAQSLGRRALRRQHARASPSPRATRSRRRSGSASRSTATASAISSTRSRTCRRRRSTRSSREYDAAYEVVPALRPDGDRREALRDAARIEAGLRAFLDARRLRGLHRHLRGPRTACTQLPGIAVQRLMADGYGFGAKGDWKTAALVRVAQGDERRADGRHVVHGGLHLPPDAGRREGARRAHARGLPVDRRRTALVRDPSALDRRHDDPVRLVFTAATGPAVVVAMLDLGDRFRMVANEIDVVPPERGAAAAAGRPRGLEAEAGPVARRRRPGCSRAVRTTPSSRRRSASRRSPTSPRSPGSSSS